MVQVLNKRWAGPIIYCLGVLGTISLVALLLPVVLIHVIVLARPHLEGGPPPLSLIQRRQIDAAVALPPSPNRATTPLVPTEVPMVPLTIYAARLDVAEAEDVAKSTAVAAFEQESEPSSIATGRMNRVARADPRFSRVTAGDIFNRSFGVITAAAN
jgi:hypothetical protein